MRRDRFRQIMRFFHCADNTQLNKSDKMSKLRPLMTLLKNKFAENLVMQKCANYDESMIKYFGKHGCKQFIRGKPIRFGYKAWCLNLPNGYLVDFELYQGEYGVNQDYAKSVGKCAAPLLTMLDNLPNQVKALPLQLYFDNLFTCFPLLSDLKARGYHGTGTVRENRLPKAIPIKSKKEMAKVARGTYEFVTEQDESIILIRWKDNSVVSVLSSCHGVSPVSGVTRYSRTEKKRLLSHALPLLQSTTKAWGVLTLWTKM